MQHTTNYNLNVVELNDAPPDISKVSENFPIIDAILKDHEDLFGSYVPLKSVKSKGNETTPIYFDANGVAQTITRYGGTSARATADGSGNVLTSFYEPKQNLAGKGDSVTPVYIDADGVAQETEKMVTTVNSVVPDVNGNVDVKTLKTTYKNNLLSMSKSLFTEGVSAFCGNTAYESNYPVGSDNADYNLLTVNAIDNVDCFQIFANNMLAYFRSDDFGDGWTKWYQLDLIDEFGNNFIRYANGIQICWGYDVGAYYNYWTYPKAFTSNPVIVATHRTANVSLGGNWQVVATELNTTRCKFAVYATNSSTQNTSSSADACAIAIGRWK